MACPHEGLVLSNEKEGTIDQATAWMKPTCFKLSEESQTQKTVPGTEEERLEGGGRE
jgi:hypothetical protein